MMLPTCWSAIGKPARPQYSAARCFVCVRVCRGAVARGCHSAGVLGHGSCSLGAVETAPGSRRLLDVMKTEIARHNFCSDKTTSIPVMFDV